MAAFAGKNWPATSDACAVESAAVIFLPITVVIVTTPARPLWQIILEHAIDDFDRIADDRIVRVANTESHQMKKVTANYVSRRMEAAAVGQLNHRCIWIGVRIRRVRVRGIDANVMTRESIDQFTPGCNSPFFNVYGQ